MKLTPREAAERARVSQNLIYQWCAEKRLPHLRLGRRGSRGKILIEQADLDAFLERQKVEGGEEPPPAPKPVRQQFQHLKL